MRAWRIAKHKFALDRSGAGAYRHGGRWNNAGMHAIYAGLTPEIAALEKLIHTGDILPADLVLVLIELPDDATLYETPALAALPAGWNELPSSVAAASLGSGFLMKGKQLGLIIPSVVIPEASNIMINPHHPDFTSVTMNIVRPFKFDSRFRP